MSSGGEPVAGGIEPVVGGIEPVVGGIEPVVGGIVLAAGGIEPVVGGIEPVVGGIVLAAGGGTRFGATKQLAPLRGRPLLSYAVESILNVPAVWPVVVVLGHDAQAILREVEFHDATVVVCDSWQHGQSASLRAGIEALGEVDAALVTLGDQPRITPQVISAVLESYSSRWDAVRATYGGAPGHPVLLGRRLLAQADELRGDAGFRDLLEAARVRRFEAGHLCDPVDVDTREELAGL